MAKSKDISPEVISAVMAAMGSKGGSAEVPSKGFGSLTPEQRAANAKKAAEARWGKKKAKKK
ncbi:MAG: hypothetical protein ABJF23_30380 [Bryobacteraceae bacterium]